MVLESFVFSPFNHVIGYQPEKVLLNSVAENAVDDIYIYK